MTERSLLKMHPAQRVALSAIVALVLWFTFQRLDSSLSDAVDVLRTASPAWLIISAALALAAMTIIASGWVPLLRDAGSDEPVTGIVWWYFLGEVTKYVPGGVWALLGRGELASRALGRRSAYRTVTQSLVVLFGVASLPSAVAVLGQHSWSPVARGAAAIGLTCVLPAIYFATGIASRIFTIMVVRYAAAWITIGLVTYTVAQALGLDIDLGSAVVLTSAAWLAGFVIVFVPGGVGVREATFVSLAPATLEPSQALAIALAARLLFVGADTVGAALGLALRGTTNGDGAPL